MNEYYRTRIHNILVVVKSKKEFEENENKYVQFVEKNCKEAVNYR